ncbi:hypothetical protein OB919_16005 [Halobacteria archaeon AArc-curdl1]|uniref:Uncharacterized protein n=1 Tax=Natronosalvus hydrolyticus TaxID=2979988 RepID=A0AAP2ZCS6_9EURY|nr:hypothetical protein [Halobacteria archaeon AArc-curdl1]
MENRILHSDLYNVFHKGIKYRFDLRNALLKEIDHRETMPDMDADWSYGLSGRYMSLDQYITVFWLNAIWGLTFRDSWKYNLNVLMIRGEKPGCGLEFKQMINKKPKGENQE